MEKIINKLKEKKYRITNSRYALIEVFFENSKEHFTTEELIEKLESKDLKVNVMSLYNNLKILLEEKIIQESILKGKKVYELTDGNHMHFFCKSCNKHIDIDYKEDKKTIEKLEDEYNFHIEGVKIEYSGLCKECIDKEIDEPNS